MANADAISRDVSQDLEAVFGRVTQPPTPSAAVLTTVLHPARPKRRNTMRYAGAIATAVLAGVTVGSLVSRQKPPRTPSSAPVIAAPRILPARADIRGPQPIPVRGAVAVAVAEPPGARPLPLPVSVSVPASARPSVPGKRLAAAPIPLRPTAPLRIASPPAVVQQVEPPAVPAPTLQVVEAARAPAPERACPAGTGIWPDCDAQVVAADEDLHEAYLVARRAGVPARVLSYDQARWAETRASAAARSRQALLGAYRAHTEDLLDSAESALSRGSGEPDAPEGQ